MTSAGAKVSKVAADRREGPVAGTAVTLTLYFKFGDSGIVRVAGDEPRPATTAPEAYVPFVVYTLVTLVVTSEPSADVATTFVNALMVVVGSPPTEPDVAVKVKLVLVQSVRPFKEAEGVMVAGVTLPAISWKPFKSFSSAVLPKFMVISPLTSAVQAN